MRPGIGVHLAHERVDRLDLGEPVAVVQVRGDRDRLRQVLVDRRQLERALDERRRRAAERAVERRSEEAVGDVRDRAQRRDEAHLAEVERARDERGRRDRQRVVAGEREQRHDPAQAPAEQLDRLSARVLADRADRARQHVADPELEAEVLVRERDVAVLDEVGRVPGREQVLGERAAAAQVEADAWRGQRRHEQDRQVVLGIVVRRQVAVDDALRRLADDLRGRAAQIGDAASEDHVERVRCGARDALGARYQFHTGGPTGTDSVGPPFTPRPALGRPRRGTRSAAR